MYLDGNFSFGKTRNYYQVLRLVEKINIACWKKKPFVLSNQNNRNMYDNRISKVFNFLLYFFHSISCLVLYCIFFVYVEIHINVENGRISFYTTRCHTRNLFSRHQGSIISLVWLYYSWIDVRLTYNTVALEIVRQTLWCEKLSIWKISSRRKNSKYQ